MSARHQTRAQYCAHIAGLAREAYARHEITAERPGRWELFHRDDAGKLRGHFCAEIVVLCWGRLLVHGDGSTVLFGECSDHAPDAVLRWIGARAPAGDFRYLASKVQRAMDASAECVDDRVARADLLEEIRTLRRDGVARKNLEPYRDALAALDAGDPVEMVRHDLWTRAAADVDTEWLARLGRVVDPRVIYGQAACARLVRLLDARAGVPAQAVVGHGI